MKKITIAISAFFLLSIFSCKREQLSPISKIQPLSIETKADAEGVMKTFFVFSNNIEHYPDKSVLKKVLSNAAIPKELKEFSNNLGFNSFEELNSEYLKFAITLQSISKKYPELLDKKEGKAEIAKIANETFANENFNIYKTKFQVGSPYKKRDNESSTSSKSASPNMAAPDCCHCTDAYNSALNDAYYLLCVDAVGCGVVAAGSGGIGGVACMWVATSHYDSSCSAALASWDFCVSYGAN